MSEPERPSGTVTFLFSDIEGSTRLVKQLRDRYAGVLASTRACCAPRLPPTPARRSTPRATRSSSPSRARATPCWLPSKASSRFLSHGWPEGVQVRVRMGIHTGHAGRAARVATRASAVHRAARICAAGHGGQVLVSQATQTLLEDEEEDLEITLRDLGEQSLKDFIAQSASTSWGPKGYRRLSRRFSRRRAVRGRRNGRDKTTLAASRHSRCDALAFAALVAAASSC